MKKNGSGRRVKDPVDEALNRACDRLGVMGPKRGSGASREENALAFRAMRLRLGVGSRRLSLHGLGLEEINEDPDTAPIRRKRRKGDI